MSGHLRELIVDLDAIAANTQVLVSRSGSAGVMAVVKADAYGHGLVPSARAAVAGGAQWLGVALVDEALALRDGGVEDPVLAWLVGPGEPWAEALTRGIDLSVSDVWVLDEIAAAAREVGRVARVHLKVDSGLGRSGAPVGDWPTLVEAARKAELDGIVVVVGVWSHLAYADAPGHPTIDRQLDVFGEAVRRGRTGGSATGGPPPRQLRGDPHPAGHALRPDPPRAGGLRAVTAAGRASRLARAAPRDVACRRG